MPRRIWLRSLQERDRLAKLCMHRSFFRSIGIGENWIHLAQDSETFGAVLNTAMELRGS